MNSRTNKPEFFGEQYAARFQNQSVVDRYHLRATYPPETFRMLADLIDDEPRTILDVGCGSGDVARHLLHLADRIDAVDVSLPMLEKGRTLPGGDSPKIRWLHGKIEEIELALPYVLITAGQSLHWMDWDVELEQSLQDRIEGMHAQSSLSRDDMGEARADAYDREVKALLLPYTNDGKIILHVRGHIVWGKPLTP